MFEKLVLRNWQRFQKLVVEFDEHVTVIVGNSDKGKSSIIRALRQLCTNEFSGTWYIKHGEDRSAIKLHFDNGRVLRKSRGASENSYDLDGETFTAFGMGKVPETIVQALNVSDANFQKQIDLPFWFTESAGQVSKNLNQIVNLGDIDSSLSVIASEVRKSRAEAEVSEKRLNEAKQELQRVEWVPDFYKAVQRLREREEAYEVADAEVTDLSSLIGVVQTAGNRKEELALLAQSSEKLLSKAGDVARVNLDLGVLEALISDAERSQHFANREVPNLEKLITIRQQGELLVDQCRLLEEDVSLLESAKERMQTLSIEFREAEIELKKRTPELCPKCGQPITKSGRSQSATSTSQRTHPSHDQ